MRIWQAELNLAHHLLAGAARAALPPTHYDHTSDDRQADVRAEPHQLDWTALLNVLASPVADATLRGWLQVLDRRDRETRNHSERVARLTVRLAHALGLSDGELLHLRRGALLHDIGKIMLPDAILLKQGHLTEAEWEVMRRHPGYARALLQPIPYLQPALAIPYCHHEKWDGTGYPRGLKGEAIPLAARLFAVVDVWDALRSQRPYRPAWPVKAVTAHILSQAGRHFDPRVAEAFLRLIGPAGAAGIQFVQ